MRPGLDGRKHIRLTIKCGEDQHAHLRRLTSQRVGRPHPIQCGHPQIHQDDIGIQALGKIYRFVAVPGLSNDHDVSDGFETTAQAASYDRMVVSNEQTDHASVPPVRESGPEHQHAR